jgi:hypothetical protein
LYCVADVPPLADNPAIAGVTYPIFVRNIPVPEIIDPVFAKTSQNARFLLSENERFGLVFVKTGSINSGTVVSAALVSTAVMLLAPCREFLLLLVSLLLMAS